MPAPSGSSITESAPSMAVILMPRELALLEACVAWHARVHADPDLARRFASLQQRLHDARPIVAAD